MPAGWIGIPGPTWPGWVWTSGTSLQIGGSTTSSAGGFAGQAPLAMQPPSPAAVQPPAPPPTLVDVAMAAMAQRRPAVAVEALRREIREQGEQGSTLRLLALALAMDRRWEHAAAVMRAAYRLDPKLTTTPLDAAAAGLDARQLRDTVKSAVQAAHRAASASPWLLVAALMQAEGREALASTMASRAAKAGLEPEIAAGFAGAAGKVDRAVEDAFSDRK